MIGARSSLVESASHAASAMRATLAAGSARHAACRAAPRRAAPPSTASASTRSRSVTSRPRAHTAYAAAASAHAPDAGRPRQRPHVRERVGSDDADAERHGDGHERGASRAGAAGAAERAARVDGASVDGACGASEQPPFWTGPAPAEVQGRYVLRQPKKPTGVIPAKAGIYAAPYPAQTPYGFPRVRE